MCADYARKEGIPVIEVTKIRLDVPVELEEKAEAKAKALGKTVDVFLLDVIKAAVTG